MHHPEVHAAGHDIRITIKQYKVPARKANVSTFRPCWPNAGSLLA